MNIHITDRFDSGNIRVIDAHSTDNIRLQIKPDANSEHMQWFHYRVVGAANQALMMSIENAGDVSFTNGWEGYQTCACYDGEEWFRIDTRYENGVLTMQHTPTHNSVYYAYFAPYTEDRHRRIIGNMQQKDGVSLEVLGQTLDGRDIDMLSVGEGVIPIWMISRQHPGESMAEWMVEGFLERINDSACALSKSLLQQARFYIVPNMNPDGSVRGHLRTNAIGVNLNREWHAPSMERSPEVFLTLQRMQQTGVAFCLDVHGDEGLPYNFIAGADGVDTLPEAIVTARFTYELALKQANPDFQTEYGYPAAAPGQANLSLAANQLAAQFGALSMTFEQPFKDNADAPMPDEGWSPRRAKAMGRSQVDAIAAVIDVLRSNRT